MFWTSKLWHSRVSLSEFKFHVIHSTDIEKKAANVLPHLTGPDQRLMDNATSSPAHRSEKKPMFWYMQDFDQCFAKGGAGLPAIYATVACKKRQQGKQKIPLQDLTHGYVKYWYLLQA